MAAFTDLGKAILFYKADGRSGRERVSRTTRQECRSSCIDTPAPGLRAGPREGERERAAEADVCARVSVRVCACLQVAAAAAAAGTRAGDPSAATSLPRIFQGGCSFG